MAGDGLMGERGTLGTGIDDHHGIDAVFFAIDFGGGHGAFDLATQHINNGLGGGGDDVGGLLGGGTVILGGGLGDLDSEIDQDIGAIDDGSDSLICLFLGGSGTGGGHEQGGEQHDDKQQSGELLHISFLLNMSPYE